MIYLLETAHLNVIAQPQRQNTTCLNVISYQLRLISKPATKLYILGNRINLPPNIISLHLPQVPFHPLRHLLHTLRIPTPNKSRQQKPVRRSIPSKPRSSVRPRIRFRDGFVEEGHGCCEGLR